jgi:hypothetical protein
MTLQRQIVEEISIQEKNGYFCKRERRMHNIIREKNPAFWRECPKMRLKHST